MAPGARRRPGTRLRRPDMLSAGASPLDDSLCVATHLCQVRQQRQQRFDTS